MVADLFSVLETKVVCDESGSDPHDLNEFMLESQSLSSENVDLEEHLVCHCMDIGTIDIEFSVFESQREGLRVPNQGILIVFEHGYVASDLLLGS